MSLPSRNRNRSGTGDSNAMSGQSFQTKWCLRFACLVTGELGRVVYRGNQAVEFGVTGEGGEIVSTELFDDAIDDSYSVEFWIKPSHYHLGSVAL